ncbi:CdaR family protein [Treponema pedis]|uniref:YbbR-like protein n=2 Tax=Treponema pedis TaxID=409322 RepID=S5ZPW1_9SPIR|nr:CdaR family protein [Treponema pedis]AGT44672.1 hypothetical protein TPE_2198 [Treponema pedis str. T A4]QOW59994.1 hypothetical protein IFE08_09030 [Treponema pedis]QSI05334.1 hypothetical protein DYQ05_10635 [Treponema pedis]
MKISKNIEKLLENWPAKVLSFVFALVLVQFYKNSLLEKRYFSVPLIIENSGDLVPSAAIPRMVKVSIWGEAAGISTIREDDIVAYLDFSSIPSEGEHEIPIRTRRQGLALDISPLEITVEPSEIKLNLEKSVSKRLNVKLTFKGFPEQNYEVYETVIDPPSIEVTGPESIVSKMEDIFTNSIQIENKRTGFSGTTDLLNPDPIILIAGNSRISYSVKIREMLEIKTFMDINLYFDGLADKFEIAAQVPLGNVTIKGAKTAVSAWKPSINTLRVSCGNIVKPGIYSLPVQAVIPGKLELVDANPKNIQIEVRERESSGSNN